MLEGEERKRVRHGIKSTYRVSFFLSLFLCHFSFSFSLCYCRFAFELKPAWTKTFAAHIPFHTYKYIYIRCCVFPMWNTDLREQVKAKLAWNTEKKYQTKKALLLLLSSSLNSEKKLFFSTYVRCMCTIFFTSIRILKCLLYTHSLVSFDS